MRTMDAESVDCVVTSPPYWGLRDYGVEGQMGLEPTLGEHLEVMVNVFAEVHRILKPTGTLWLNYGDCYATTPNGKKAADYKADKSDDRTFRDKPFSTIGPIYDPEYRKRTTGGIHEKRRKDSGGRIVAGGILKPKDLCLVPNRLAIALQEPMYLGKIKRENDRVWLAAFIDGEGSIYIQNQKKGTKTGRGRKYTRNQDSFCAGLAISNTSRALIDHCASILGQSNIQTYHPSGSNRRTHYQFRVTGNKAKNILREIYPYLVGKRQEARIAINCPPSGDVADKCWQELKALHKTGQSDFDLPHPNTEDLWRQGWWVRSEIIWAKPNPMPESITDRPATSHEKIWLLTKSAKYFYDAEAVKEPCKTEGVEYKSPDGWDTGSGSHGSFHKEGREKGHKNLKKKSKSTGVGFRYQEDGEHPKRTTHSRGTKKTPPIDSAGQGHKDWSKYMTKDDEITHRNLRNVWHIGTKPFSEAHFATFPPQLAETCIKAGCPQDGVVFDPFGGAGTTGLVADQLQRDAIMIELNPEYIDIAKRRIEAGAPMFTDVIVEQERCRETDDMFGDKEC